MLTLVRELLSPVPGGSSTDLSKLLSTAARVVHRRSLVVLISDFISEPGWERPLLRLTERNEVVAVRLVDPREYELPGCCSSRTQKQVSKCWSIRATLSSAAAS